MDVEQNRRRPTAPHRDTRLDGNHWPARTRQVLEETLDQCLTGLHGLLITCLIEFEQQLFAMAERARHPAEQQDFIASRQLIQRNRDGFDQHFTAQLVEAFNGLGTEKNAPDDATTGAKPWQTLELLDTAQQELSMTLDQIGSRGDMRHGSVLHELGYRLAVLVGAPPLEGPALPLGPHALAQACLQTSGELELQPAHQILLLQQFDRCVIHGLAPLYETVNASLRDNGILPQLRNTVVPRHPGKKRSRPVDGAAVQNESDPVATDGGNPPAGGTGSMGHGEPIEVLESLRNLLAQQRAAQGNGTMPPAGRAASEDELQAALGALQQHLAQVTDRASRELRSAARLREELLAQLNFGKPGDAPRTELSGEQGDKVELVTRLFEQLARQLQKGSNAHHLLGNLQLPVLRMAVADQGFFEKREHPARRLLDTVTAAANDWLDGSDDENNRPLASKLEQLVARANQEPPSAGLYTTLLADIEHHLALLTRKAQAAERRHVEAAKGRERLDRARQRASELMAERFAQSPPRGLLRALLDRAWSDVLALTLLRHGEDSEAFTGQLVITDQLLGRLPIDDRSQLQQQVETGLQQIGMHAEEAEQVAQRLLGPDKPDPAADLPSATDLALRLKQHQRLGEKQSAPPKQSTTPKPATAPPGPTATTAAVTAVPVANVAAATSTTATTAPSAPSPARAPEPSPRQRRIEEHLRKLPFGSWFEFVDTTSGQITRRKLAWYSTMSGRCLLVSRRGQPGEEMTLSQLAHAIATGHACEWVEQRESLLDRAWHSLTRSLYQTTDNRHPSAPESGY